MVIIMMIMLMTMTITIIMIILIIIIINRPCVVKKYNQQEGGLLKRNPGDLEE